MVLVANASNFVAHMQTFCYSFVTDFTCLCDVASRSADQQFEVGTREFVDVFACVQYKDEQVCC